MKIIALDRELTVDQVAALVGTTSLKIRCGLQQGLLPIGYSYRANENTKTNTAYISMNRFCDYYKVDRKEVMNQLENFELERELVVG